MSLPNDVVDYLLSFLQSDIAALKACARAHPTLSALSDQYIYANLILHDDFDRLDSPEHLATSNFALILAKRPDIANHVRSLTVCISHAIVPLSERGKATYAHLDGVASVLPTLSGLTKLNVKGYPQSLSPFSWRTLPDSFGQAVLHFLRLPSYKDITISRVAFFPLYFLNHSKYARATLDTCEDTQYDDEELAAEIPGRAIFEHLSVRNCSQTCLENISAWLKTHHFRSLKYKGLGGVSEMKRLLPQLLVPCSDSLTNLDLDVEDYYRSWYEISDNSAVYKDGIAHFPFTLTGLCHLGRLTITARLNSYALNASGRPEVRHSPIPAIIQLISTAPPTLRQIYLNLAYNFWGFGTPDPKVVWIPLKPLAAKCSSLSIKAYISPLFQVSEPKEDIPAIFSLFADYLELMPYVEKGVVVVTMPQT